MTDLRQIQSGGQQASKSIPKSLSRDKFSTTTVRKPPISVDVWLNDRYRWPTANANNAVKENRSATEAKKNEIAEKEMVESARLSMSIRSFGLTVAVAVLVSWLFGPASPVKELGSEILILAIGVVACFVAFVLLIVSAIKR